MFLGAVREAEFTQSCGVCRKPIDKGFLQLAFDLSSGCSGPEGYVSEWF
jgi:hypothetical protein